MIIGNFTCNEAQDTYTGELATLTVAAHKMVFQPIEAKGDKAPSYRVVSPSKTGNVELGAAWIKRSEEGRNYLRSSSTIRAWRSRSTAPWCSPATARSSSSCGRATGASRKAHAT